MQDKNVMENMMACDYGSEKLSKYFELNETMSLNDAQQDEYTKCLFSIGR